ncbi:MAG: chemotaxis protein CheW [Parasphingopyxis sp.]|uniref:chemotaxis protein CheW n=1 Tax=Parasphingopyxis sp. TaxID=1920299 RepID=UPI003FA013E6
MNQLYLVAEIGETQFAIPADAVQSVVTASDIIAVPRAAPTVAGIAALRSKVITVIDTRAAIEGGNAQAVDGQSLIVAEVGGYLYGLAVDEIHDVREHTGTPQKLGAAFEPGWQRVSTGVIDLDGAAIAVVDPAALIDEDHAAAA